MHFIHSSMRGHLNFLHILAILNSAAMNMGVKIPLCDPYFIFSEEYPEVGFAGCGPEVALQLESRPPTEVSFLLDSCPPTETEK